MPISINTLLKSIPRMLDPQFFSPLKHQNSKTGQINFTNSSHAIYFKLTQSGIEIERSIPDPDIILSGRPQDLLILLLSNHKLPPAAVCKHYNINISGDIGVLITLQAIREQADINWEGHLSKLIGAFPAAFTHTILKTHTQWVQNLIHNRAHDFVLFLEEEQKSLPTHYELSHFYNQVDTLRQDTERLEKKLEKILNNYKNNKK